MSMLDSFLVRAALAGIGLAIAAAPLGCFVVWRRMAYFGDATAHAAVLGVALALALNTSVFFGVLVVALLMALLVSNLSQRGLAIDTLLGVMAHSALAVGLVAVALIDGIRIDLMSFLFGDILAVGKVDLIYIAVGVAAVLGLLIWRWNELLTATLSPDLAHASGINPKREQLILTIALAIVVAVSIKVVGALLIGSLLVIPAAASRPFATTPERMAIFAGMIGVFATLGGLYFAFEFDTPTGPTIVCCAATMFFVSQMVTSLKR